MVRKMACHILSTLDDIDNVEDNEDDTRVYQFRFLCQVTGQNTPSLLNASLSTY